MDFDKNLGAYPMDNHQQWSGLSNYITPDVISKLETLNTIIMSEEEERQKRKQEEPETTEVNLDETIEAL